MSETKHRRICNLNGCKVNNIEHPALSFFSLPAEGPRRLEWLHLMGREDLLHTDSTQYYVCEAHFNSFDVIESPNRKLLKRSAVPTLLLPKHLQAHKNIQVRPLTADRYLQTFWRGSDNQTQTTVALQNQLPLVKKLKAEISEVKRLLRYQENRKKEQRFQFHTLCDKFLSEELAALVKAQTNLKEGHKGNRYNYEYKKFCMNLYYVSPHAYTLLEKTIHLPCKATLNRLHVPTSSMVCDDIMAALKVKVDNMSQKERNCSVVLDAMTVRHKLFPDAKNKKTIGFDEVDGVETPAPAKYALIVMARGIFMNWTQPVGYAFLSERQSYGDVAVWIDKILVKLFDIGLRVRAFVSDLDTDFFNPAEKRAVSINTPYFSINGNRVYYIFDAPQLIRSVRDNLIKYNFHMPNGGVAKHEHIIQFHQQDKRKIFKLASKLTGSHVNPKKSERTKVQLATQLLSKSVATGMSTYIEFRVMDESARHTVQLIRMMNDLFDTLNSSTVNHNYDHKKAFRGENYQMEFLHQMLIFFQSLVLRDPTTGMYATWTDARFHGAFQITIRAILLLFDELKQEGHKHLFTKRLNQDCTKAFFDKLRPKDNNTAREPTCRQFRIGFRQSYLNSILKPPKDSGSADLAKLLAGLNEAMKSEQQQQQNDNSQMNVSAGEVSAVPPVVATNDVATNDVATGDIATCDVATSNIATSDITTSDIATNDIATCDVATSITSDKSESSMTSMAVDPSPPVGMGMGMGMGMGGMGMGMGMNRDTVCFPCVSVSVGVDHYPTAAKLKEGYHY